MKILIINAHWHNRGDEAALRAMIDELAYWYPDAEIKVKLQMENTYFPYTGRISLAHGACPAGGRIRFVDFWLRYLTKGKLGFRSESAEFVREIKNSDIVIHAPGGPSIGDIYAQWEFDYLARFLMAQRLKKPYLFFAPSMGPFLKKKHDFLRKKVLNGACKIMLREPISAQHVVNYGIKKDVTVTMDSAFQHPVEDRYAQQFAEDKDLTQFISQYRKVIGITITDLMWNPKYEGNRDLANKINETFRAVVTQLTAQGYGVVFIPQLFGRGNDAKYMGQFANENCYVLPVNQKNDCYYQQYVISQMYAVIGMRYHSNIFAAKMGTPFISISYEQKMAGFMQLAGLQNYCIDIDQLDADTVMQTFNRLCVTYEEYKTDLNEKKADWIQRSQLTTKITKEIIDTVCR